MASYAHLPGVTTIRTELRSEPGSGCTTDFLPNEIQVELKSSRYYSEDKELKFHGIESNWYIIQKHLCELNEGQPGLKNEFQDSQDYREILS